MGDAWKDWERAIAAEARIRGLPWERRLRGGDHADMLDIDGPLPDGWLIGGKAIGRTVDMGDRMSSAMAQCDRAMTHLAARYGESLASGVIPVQVIKRQGKPAGRAYAVMEYRYLLDLVVERRKWRGNQ